MSADRIRCACVLLALLVCSVGEVGAEGDSSFDKAADPATQLWANVTLGKMTSRWWYLELDIEPKIQLTSGEEWHNLDLTPLVEFYPSSWLDLEAEITVGATHQYDGLDTFELTPRIGMKFHLFGKMVDRRASTSGVGYERLPLTRLGISTLLRLEWRNFYYSDDTADCHEWRARIRLESKVAINHAKLSADRTLYAMADVEYFGPLGNDVVERYVNKVRTRVGLGYRHSAERRIEILSIRDWNRSAPDESSINEAQAIDLRVKIFF